MIDADTFLITLAETQRRTQSAVLDQTTLPSNRCALPPALELILEKGGLIQPQLARSPYVPSGNRADIEHMYSLVGDEASWLLDTEASGIIAVEFSRYCSPFWLFRRPGEYKTFERTLRFHAHNRIFVLFSVPHGRHISRGWGQGIHWRTSILIPPSRVLWGPNDEIETELDYVDPAAPLLPAIETLLGPPVRPY
jgi:hypothetical protein